MDIRIIKKLIESRTFVRAILIVLVLVGGSLFYSVNHVSCKDCDGVTEEILKNNHGVAFGEVYLYLHNERVEKNNGVSCQYIKKGMPIFNGDASFYVISDGKIFPNQAMIGRYYTTHNDNLREYVIEVGGQQTKFVGVLGGMGCNYGWMEVYAFDDVNKSLELVNFVDYRGKEDQELVFRQLEAVGNYLVAEYYNMDKGGQVRHWWEYNKQENKFIEAKTEVLDGPRAGVVLFERYPIEITPTLQGFLVDITPTPPKQNTYLYNTQR